MYVRYINPCCDVMLRNTLKIKWKKINSLQQQNRKVTKNSTRIIPDHDYTTECGPLSIRAEIEVEDSFFVNYSWREGQRIADFGNCS